MRQFHVHPTWHVLAASASEFASYFLAICWSPSVASNEGGIFSNYYASESYLPFVVYYLDPRLCRSRSFTQHIT